MSLVTWPSITLIGMPGAGKTTIGEQLARKRGQVFCDTDRLIEQREGKSLQAILDHRGYLVLRQIEEQVLLAQDFSAQVIASGGSAVYSAKAMIHVGKFGPRVFLDIPVEEIEQRVQNFAVRGIAGAPGQSLIDLYAERQPLYERFADLRIDGAGLNEAQLLTAVEAALL
jgi:shikimate kinase